MGQSLPIAAFGAVIGCPSYHDHTVTAFTVRVQWTRSAVTMNETDRSRLVHVQNHACNLVLMKKLIALLLSSSLLASLSLVGPAEAGRISAAPPSPTGLVLREDVRNGGLFQLASQIVPLSQVLEMINAIEPGNQLDTQIVTENGRPFYIVRWQASRGRIMIFKVDAQSGQIVGRQG